MSETKIPSDYLDLFDKRAFASLATLMPDGRPQVTPVWVLYEPPYVVVNTTRGRVKDENMRRNPRVAVEVRDPDNPYRYVTVQGRVARISEEDGREIIDKMAKKYHGHDTYQGSPDEQRVTYRILPEQVHAQG